MYRLASSKWGRKGGKKSEKENTINFKIVQEVHVPL